MSATDSILVENFIDLFNNFKISKIKPVKIDFEKARITRQKNNNLKVFNLIKDMNLKKLKKEINIKELNKILEEVELKEFEFLERCSKDNILNKIVSRQISKKSTRQGKIDEKNQIEICNSVSIKYGIMIEPLDVRAFTPVKNGGIKSKNELKKENIKKSSCLKSFDARIFGKVNGWVFAKIVYGSGGHQDNVFREADEICNWVKNYNDNKILFIILIDTNLVNKLLSLKNKYMNITNILIGDHYEIQKKIIEKYSD